VACHLPTSETVPMLVPNPGDVARVHIGDKDMDQVKLKISGILNLKHTIKLKLRWNSLLVSCCFYVC
jgi:hypothetical protein